MDWGSISLPHRSEDINCYVNDTGGEDLTYTEFSDLIQGLRDREETGNLFYTMWYQDQDDTNGELMVLEVSVDYREGDIVRYREELVE